MPDARDRATHLGVDLPSQYRCVVRHTRFEPVRHTFQYRTTMALVDLDSGLRGRRLFTVHAADHLGDPRRTLSENIRNYLALNGIDAKGGKVFLLAMARTAGRTFDPASFYWCHDRTGRLLAVVVEVRNTFGERHCYVVHPDEAGRANFEKSFYVSPFLPVDGRYRMRLRLDSHHVSVTIALRRGQGDAERTALVATVRGKRVENRWLSGCLIIANIFPGHRISTLIYWQSLRLRLRGLRTSRRRYHPPQPGVATPPSTASDRSKGSIL